LGALGGSGRRFASVVVLALSGCVEVFSDSVGVDEPGGHTSCGGHSGGGDGHCGGLQRLDAGEDASAFVLAVFGPGCPKRRRACCCRGHPASPAGEVFTVSGS
jgi:hypothetical protein